MCPVSVGDQEPNMDVSPVTNTNGLITNLQTPGKLN